MAAKQGMLFETSPENPEDDRRRRWAKRPTPHNRTATSVQAANSVASAKLTVSEQIFCFVRSRGWQGATREEIADELQIRIQTVCARVNELLQATDLVEAIGRTRKTQTGRAAAIVVAGR